MNIKELTIAHIGLGRMGAGIANNIQAAGCHFVVYNRSTEKVQPFVAAGAKAARTPREAAAAADIVVTSLMDDKSVFDVISGEDGILAGMRGGAIHIGTTTISPGASTRCSGLHAVQGSHYLSPPYWEDRALPRQVSYSRSWPANRKSSTAQGRSWNAIRKTSLCWAKILPRPQV